MNPNRISLVGVINVSPESFFKGSVADQKNIAKKARRLAEEGAHIIDVGALSTAPYLETSISEKEEARRLSKAVAAIKKAVRLPISIDTSRVLPAAAGLQAGAEILNDVSGLRRAPKLRFIAKRAKKVILMAHPMGYSRKELGNPVQATRKILRDTVRSALQSGIPKSKIILDPGIGFFRTAPMSWWKWDLAVLQNLKTFRSMGFPLLIGASRKSFIGKITGEPDPANRLSGSLIAGISAARQGVRYIRTHDVKATRDALQVASLLKIFKNS